MALAASVGDSLLDSTMGDDMGFINARGIEPMTRQKQGARGDPGNQKTGTSIVSWAEPSLQPHQVSYANLYARLVAELRLSFVDKGLGVRVRVTAVLC